jgi:hypothetical protein
MRSCKFFITSHREEGEKIGNYLISGFAEQLAALDSDQKAALSSEPTFKIAMNQIF